ncbi:odorant receptor 10 [Calliopsis andreniformis]|uniref:odorant receptor 10 n=1 Tax=Calliopsis andreniformis TaxID=337506 RepID=UPI003FCEDB31
MDVFVPEKTKLRQCKPNRHLNISLSMIYYMGMWPNKSKYRYLYYLYTLCSFIFLLGIFLVSEIAYLIISWGNMEKIVAGATILMTNATHACKVILILWRKNRIQALIDVTKSEIFNRDNGKYERIVTHYTWQGIFHHIAYQSFGAMAVFCWGITPIANMLAGKSKQLPMEGWYPYNVTTSPSYEITSTHQTVAIIICCFNNVAIDTLITGFITIACCQLTLLSRNIIEINSRTDKLLIVSKDDIDVRKSAVNNCKKAYENLKLCVQHSNMIFDFSKEIQNIFGTVVFLQFLVNCIIICFIAFNIAQMKIYIPSVVFGMTMYMCCMTYQIFIFCWHGNELYLHSASVVLATYWSDWWNESQNFKRAIQIIMVRAQKPLILTAGNIMELSLQTFVRILRMSYSIFTVLQTSANT